MFSFILWWQVYHIVWMCCLSVGEPGGCREHFKELRVYNCISSYMIQHPCAMVTNTSSRRWGGVLAFPTLTAPRVTRRPQRHRLLLSVAKNAGPADRASPFRCVHPNWRTSRLEQLPKWPCNCWLSSKRQMKKLTVSMNKHPGKLQ